MFQQYRELPWAHYADPPVVISPTYLIICVLFLNTMYICLLNYLTAVHTHVPFSIDFSVSFPRARIFFLLTPVYLPKSGTVRLVESTAHIRVIPVVWVMSFIAVFLLLVCDPVQNHMFHVIVMFFQSPSIQFLSPQCLDAIFRSAGRLCGRSLGVCSFLWWDSGCHFRKHLMSAGLMTGDMNLDHFKALFFRLVHCTVTDFLCNK